MKFHEVGDFADVISATAQDMNIPDVFVEKDYWVTLVLYRLSKHPHSEKIVFKGGTSLSKAYGLIERFSEDVDLALTGVTDLNGNQIKTLIGNTAKDLTDSPFKEITDARTSKGSKFRRTVHSYPRLELKGEYYSASPDMLLEINSFTDPSPIIRKKVRSYIGDFLSKNSPDLLKTSDLDHFEIQVLGLERTYAEKLLGLIRYSYIGPQEIQAKVRHLYDLARLEDCKEIREMKSSREKFNAFVEQVKKTDAESKDFAGEWLKNPFASSPLFNDTKIRDAMKAAYQSPTFQSLIWDKSKAPAFEKAWEILVSASPLLATPGSQG